MKMWWAYLLFAFIGGVFALIAAILALALASRSGNMMSIHFGDSGFQVYKELELLDSDVRSGGIYVKFKNAGERRLGLLPVSASKSMAKTVLYSLNRRKRSTTKSCLARSMNI